MGDLLWSDPDDIKGWVPSPRGTGYTWGQNETEKFLISNRLTHITRGHQLQMKGNSKTHGDKVITVFSAPNYCYRCGNEASVMEVDESMNKSFLNFD